MVDSVLEAEVDECPGRVVLDIARVSGGVVSVEPFVGGEDELGEGVGHLGSEESGVVVRGESESGYDLQHGTEELLEGKGESEVGC